MARHPPAAAKCLHRLTCRVAPLSANRCQECGRGRFPHRPSASEQAGASAQDAQRSVSRWWIWQCNICNWKMYAASGSLLRAPGWSVAPTASLIVTPSDEINLFLPRVLMPSDYPTRARIGPTAGWMLMWCDACVHQRKYVCVASSQSVGQKEKKTVCCLSSQETSTAALLSFDKLRYVQL